MEKKPIPKRKFQEIETHVCTDLTLSCYYPRKTQKPTSSITSGNSFPSDKPANVSSSSLDDGIVSTTLNLFDDSLPVKIKHSPEKMSLECEEQETGVSIELTLSLGSTKMQKQAINDHIVKAKPVRVLSRTHNNGVASFSSRNVKIPLKMRPRCEDTNVSTELTLSCGYNNNEITKSSETNDSTEDPWKIRKELKQSDVGNLSRLLMPTELVEKHILPFMSQEIKVMIEGREGAKFEVRDCDTNTMHHLVFKRMPSSRSYVFNEKWISDFVRRRNLQKGDVIGLYWDSSRFNFSALHR